ncbi:MAG: tannase/feruloyl esterase family alpha/beta hydrolase [Bryobacteraceae bacterium]
MALIAVLFALLVFSQAPAAAASCESLTSLALPHTTITSAQAVAAGAFTPPSGSADAFKSLPAFCRVTATTRPSSDSEIRMEVWMPATGWNGRFQGVGTAGMGGLIPFNALTGPLKQGFATAANDTGHEGDSTYAISHQEKVIDWGYRAFHEMTVQSKPIVAAFYGSGPKYSYMEGCGSGAQAAQSEMQRFPADYDGIAITGFSDKTKHVFWQMWAWEATHKDEESYIPPDKFKMLHNAVLAQCDMLDGVRDGVLEDPRRCKFDPKTIECKGANAPNCLTAPQVEAVRAIYAGPKNPRTGEQIFPPPYPGSELTWYRFTDTQPFGLAADFFRFFVFKDPKWDAKTRPVNFDSDVALANRPDLLVVDGMDPDLRKFTGRGGKFLLYPGWSDTSIPPDASIAYFKEAVAKLGAKAAPDSIRMFMVPGLGHCTPAESHGSFDSIKVLEQWVENKKAPDQIIVSRVTDGKVVRTRPLCQFGTVATYKGTGSTDEAANFECKPL